MAQFLQRLLDTSAPTFPLALRQLEEATGRSGVDVRLIADITHAAHGVMRRLGLDPADTTARELYLALNAYIEKETAHELLHETDYVLFQQDGQTVSFNLIDAIENSHHQLPFEKRKLEHGKRALRGEIFQRYVEHPRTADEPTRQLAIDAGLLESGEPETASKNTASQPQDQPEKEKPMNGPKMLAIGDVFTDAFIKLNENYAKVTKDEDGTQWLSLPFGSKPPYDYVDIVKAVGPSPNAAVSFARLGLNSQLMAWVGDDQPGEEIYEYLQSQNVDTADIVTENGKMTSYWYVLRYGADRTMLVKSEQYSYQWREPAEKPDWMYLSYIGKDSWQLHEDLLAYLEKNPDVKLVFQPGTFHFEWGRDKLARVYSRSHLVVMNREEAVDVTGRPYDSIRGLAEGFHEMGVPNVVITDGPNGSYASFDGKVVTVPNYPDPKAPYDRTGAGDAFASTIVAALAQGESMETALTWAPINSMNVVQHIGAQTGLLGKADIEKYLAEAPEWYKVSEVQE